MSMTPKERFRTAAAGGIPDRVAVGEHWVPHTLVAQVVGVERSLYHAWGYTRIAYWEGRRDEVVAEMAKHYVEFIRTTGLDAVSVELVPPRNWDLRGPEKIGDGVWRDRSGARLQWVEAVHDIEVFEPGDTAVVPEPWPEPDGSEWEFWDRVVEELGKTHFIMAMGPPLSPPDPTRIGLGRSRFRAFEDLMLRIKQDPDSIAAAHVRGAESVQRGAELARERGADAVRICFDYGCNTGPYCSPADFRRAFLPGLKACVEAVHRAGVMVVLHVDGSLEPVIDQIADAGPLVYQAVQSHEPMASYQERFGSRLAFWGNVNNDRLARGTPDEIRELARRAVDACAGRGGFILGSCHDILLPTPKDNFMAMVGVALES